MSASLLFKSVSLGFVFHLVHLQMFALDMLGAKSLEVMSVRSRSNGDLREDLGCIHHIAGEDSLAEGSRRRS